jgi:maltose O-acetyltransferase
MNVLKLLNLKVIKYGFYILHDKIRTDYERYNLINKNPTLNIEENVQIKSPGRLFLGKNVIIQKGCILHCGGMAWSNFKGYIKIGDDSVISPNCIFYGAGEIEIGKRLDCGPGVMIFSSRTDYSLDLIGKKNEKRLFDKVAIGNDVILYAGAIINYGISIADGAVIGAGSVVLSNIPANEVWAGSPARFIKKR